MSYEFPKSSRILKRKEFKRRSTDSFKYCGKLIFVEYRKNFSNQSRLGVTVTKRYGKSFERNRVKRLIRESFRSIRCNLPDHLDIFVKPRMAAHNKKMNDILRELNQLLNL